MKKCSFFITFSILISCIFLSNNFNVVYSSQYNYKDILWEKDDKDIANQKSPDFNIGNPVENGQPVYHFHSGSWNFRYGLNENDLINSQVLSSSEIYPWENENGITYQKNIVVNGKDKDSENTLYRNGGAVTFVQLKNGQPTGFKLRSLITIYSGIDESKMLAVPHPIYLNDKSIDDWRVPIASLMDDNGNTYAFYLDWGNEKPNSTGNKDVSMSFEEQGTLPETAGKDQFIFEQDPKLHGEGIYLIIGTNNYGDYYKEHQRNVRVNILPMDKNKINYNFIFEDKYTGEVIGNSQHGIAKDGAEITLKSENLPAGYKLDDSNDKQTVSASEPTKIVKISQDDKTEGYGNIQYDIVFKDKDTNKVLKDDQIGIGRPGTTVPVKAPSGYEIAYHPIMNYTLSSMFPNKLVYVEKKANSIKKYFYTVKFVDQDTGKVIDIQKDSGYSNTSIRIIPPIGYTFSKTSSNSFDLNEDGMTYTSYVYKADTPYDVSFVDISTNKVVGRQIGKDRTGSLVLLTPPVGYSLNNVNDLYYKVNKDIKNTKVYVQRLVQYSSENLKFNGVISTYSDSGSINVYGEDGNVRSGLVVSPGSSWITNSVKSINGVDYYQVGPNEYIKGSDLFMYVPIEKVVTTNSGNPKSLYNSHGKLINDVALDGDTSWYTDRTSIINGKMMYRVATDKWVGSYNVK